MRSAIIALLSIVFGFLLAFWIFFQNPPAPPPPELPPVISAQIEGVIDNTLLGTPITANVSMRAETSKPLTTQIDANVLGPGGLLFDLGSKVVTFQPQESPEPQNFTFANLPENATGPYRLRLKVLQIKSDGSRRPLSEFERAFWISALPSAPPPPPPPPPAPPKPAPKKKPAPPPPPKPTAPKIEIKAVAKNQSAEYGKDFSVSVNVSNKGDGPGQVTVEIWGEPIALLPKKIWGPTAIKAGDFVIVENTFNLSHDLTEGPHEIKAASYVDGNPAASSESSISFSITDTAPIANFQEPPLKSKMGLPVTFNAEASDDKGIKAITFYLKSTESSPMILPMKLSEGTKNKGLWSCQTAPLKNPGQYSFYAEAEDTKGQKKKTEELNFVITVR